MRGWARGGVGKGGGGSSHATGGCTYSACALRSLLLSLCPLLMLSSRPPSLPSLHPVRPSALPSVLHTLPFLLTFSLSLVSPLFRYFGVLPRTCPLLTPLLASALTLFLASSLDPESTVGAGAPDRTFPAFPTRLLFCHCMTKHSSIPASIPASIEFSIKRVCVCMTEVCWQVVDSTRLPAHILSAHTEAGQTPMPCPYGCGYYRCLPAPRPVSSR